MTRTRPAGGAVTRGGHARVAAVALLATVGFALFLHAGVLARPYAADSPFLLPLRDTALRIPVGYLSFLGMIVLVLWLMRCARISGWWPGVRFAFLVGGLASIATAPPELLIGWAIGQPTEVALAGGVLGAGFERLEAGRGLRDLALKVFAFALAAAILGILLQNLQGVSYAES